MSADEADIGLLMAMTLGDKSRLSRRLQDEYSATGASHVLALSGLHLGILACLLLLAVRHRRLLWFLCPLTILLVWAFALLAGLPDSVVRAATMVTLLTLFQTSARKAEAHNSLGLAALVMLAVQPLSLLDAGFQLSFLSVLSILALMPLLSWWFSPAEQRFALSGRCPPLWFAALKLLAGFCAVTLVAQIGTAPLVAYHFGRLPLHFLLSSFLVIPLSYSILLLSVLVVLLPWFRPWLMAGLSWLAHKMNAGIGHIASWPHACIEGLHPRALTVLLLYVLAVVVGAMVWWATLRRVPRPWH
jgi:competence protein ComEC